METTQNIEQGTRIRVYFSGEKALQAAHIIAMVVERECGAKGSALIPQTGRWDGMGEQGYIVECVSDKPWDRDDAGREGLLRSVGASLQPHVKPSGLTFYVTAEQVLAMEVF